MNGTVRRAILGGALASALVGGIGITVASAQVMGPAMRMAGGQHERGPEGAAGDWFRDADGKGFGHEKGEAAFGLGRAAMARPDVDGTVAKALGLTGDALRRELAGKSVADVVQARGGDLAAVKAAIVAEFQAKLDAAVAAGTVTTDRAATMSSNLSGHLDAMLSTVHGRADGDRGRGMGKGGAEAAPGRESAAPGDAHRPGPRAGGDRGRRDGGPDGRHRMAPDATGAPSAQVPSGEADGS